MYTLACLLLLVFLTGHEVLWVALYNRLHAMPIPYRRLAILDKVPQLVVGATPLWVLVQLVRDASAPLHWWRVVLDQPLLLSYVGLCLLLVPFALAAWLRRRLSPMPAALLSNHTAVVDVVQRLGGKPLAGRLSRLLDQMPGSNTFQLHVNDKTLVVPRLPRELDGLTIVHLSDLHLLGNVTRPYFELVVEEANRLQGDLVAITGDIIDKDECLGWLAPTVGRLRAPRGVYFVLGNHDERVSDVAALRRQLVELGLIDLGGQCLVTAMRGQRVLLAGNEMPWFAPRPDVPPPAAGEEGGEELRILLAHTPDQIDWARRHRFDVMLAGHNHGGQIRFPVLGPVITPSMYGVKYASGLFDESPTLLHVSRGISGEKAIRINCPPELTRLRLRRTG